MNHNSYESLNEQRDALSRKDRQDRIKEFVRVSGEILGEENIQAIILFGSKSTGTDDIWSNFDFYVVTRKEFGWNEKFEIYRRLDFPNDIVLRTYSEMVLCRHICSLFWSVSLWRRIEQRKRQNSRCP